MRKREEILKEIEEAEPRAGWARGILDQLTILFTEADGKAPCPWSFNTRERKKHRTRDGIVERLQRCVKAPANLRRELEELDKKELEEIERRARLRHDEENATKAALLAKELQNEAVTWLLARGKTIGVDFNVAEAVMVANEIAYHAECKRLIDQGEFIDFNGQNCDGPCSGWLPGSHRCDCGNRRVDFIQGNFHTFKEPSVTGEAY